MIFNFDYEIERTFLKRYPFHYEYSYEFQLESLELVSFPQLEDSCIGAFVLSQ